MIHSLNGKAKMSGGQIVMRAEKSARNASKSKALDKAKGYDSSTQNPGSYASHTKRLNSARSSHREYLANKNSF